ncbi:MAG: hypothetical protein Q7U71_08315, partial [bacterium]|nr:hypothetical protein [bacterium]
ADGPDLRRFYPIMFFFFFVPPTKKKNQKEKSSSLKTLLATLTPCLRIASAGKQGFSGPALRFSLPAGLSELGL